MSMSNDIDGTRKGNSSDCVSNSEKVRDYAKRFPRGHWSFRGLEEKISGMERTLINLKENGMKSPGSGHPIFRVIALNW